MILATSSGLGCCLVQGGSFVVVESFLLLLPLFVGVLCLVLFLLFSNCVLLILQLSWWGRETWLLYFNCLPYILWLLVFFGSSSVCRGLQCMIVVIPDHTHLLF